MTQLAPNGLYMSNEHKKNTNKYFLLLGVDITSSHSRSLGFHIFNPFLAMTATYCSMFN